MRLIDADALPVNMSASNRPSYFELLDAIEDAPVIDAVPVVRCKDCNNYTGARGKDSGKPCGYGQCELPTGIRGIVCADDYCSFGERRDSDGN